MPNTFNSSKTHCSHGHEFTEENIYRDKTGRRNCRECRTRLSKESSARVRAKRRAAREKAEARLIMGLSPSFWARAAITEAGYESPCLLWTGSMGSKGYAVVHRDRKQLYAHRLAYEARHGAIPTGVTPRPVLDHLCRNTACVNVDHLELVTDKVNVLRGVSFSAINAAKTHCKWGHEFTPENTRIENNGQRVCVTCKRARTRAREARRREAQRLAKGNP